MHTSCHDSVWHSYAGLQTSKTPTHCKLLVVFHASQWEHLACRLRGNSDILKVILPRPMGLIFEEDRAKGQAVVVDFVKGSEIEKRAKVIRQSCT